jgi:hypothetical protein
MDAVLKLELLCKTPPTLGDLMPWLKTYKNLGLLKLRKIPYGNEGKLRLAYTTIKNKGHKIKTPTSDELENYRNQGDWGLAY